MNNKRRKKEIIADYSLNKKKSKYRRHLKLQMELT
jgi:hypothetical protein